MGFGSFSFSNPLSGVGNYLKREWDTGGDYLTKMAKLNKLDKPGGSVKTQITDVVKKWSTDAEKLAWGHSSADDNSDDNTNTTTAEDLLMSSRRGIQGRSKFAQAKSEELRQQPYEFKNKTLLTQGKYAKKLTA